MIKYICITFIALLCFFKPNYAGTEVDTKPVIIMQMIYNAQKEMAQVKEIYKQIKPQIKNELKDQYKSIKTQFKNAYNIAYASNEVKNYVNRIADAFIVHNLNNDQNTAFSIENDPETIEIKNKIDGIVSAHIDKTIRNEKTELLEYAISFILPVLLLDKILLEKLEAIAKRENIDEKINLFRN